MPLPFRSIFCLGAASDFLQARHEVGLQALLELRQGIRVEVVVDVRDIPDAGLAEELIAVDVEVDRHATLEREVDVVDDDVRAVVDLDGIGGPDEEREALERLWQFIARLPREDLLGAHDARDAGRVKRLEFREQGLELRFEQCFKDGKVRRDELDAAELDEPDLDAQLVLVRLLVEIRRRALVQRFALIREDVVAVAERLLDAAQREAMPAVRQLLQVFPAVELLSHLLDCLFFHLHTPLVSQDTVSALSAILYYNSPLRSFQLRQGFRAML